ncbi:unnamed protein product, partial [Mesorhabditis spiculigera]
MAYHNRFNFDDPQDSYWNENGSAASSIFDDIRSKQESARVALDDLFAETPRPAQVNTPKPTTSTARPQQPPDPNRYQHGSGYQGRGERPTPKFMLNEPELRKDVSNVSIAPSECSFSSLPSESQQLDLDFSRLRAEHRKLQRHCEALRADRFRPPDISETIGRLFKNEPVSLDLYKSKKDKLALLDAAISFVDGNVILAVVIYIQRTVSEAIFREVLLERPEAAEEYVQYLKDWGTTEELTNVFNVMGRTADAAMYDFKLAMGAKTVHQRMAQLKKALVASFLDPRLSAEQTQIHRYINIVDRQQQIEVADSTDRSKKFTDFPRHAPLLGQPAIHTLYYACLYHYDSPPTSPDSPQQIQDLCGLNEKQLVWVSVGALVKQNRWPDVERSLSPRGLIGAITRSTGANLKSNYIPMDQLMRLIHAESGQPPKDLICRLLRSLPTPEERLMLAEKYMATEVVIECTQQMKERQRLEVYTNKLPPHSSDHYKALAALNNSGAKWK